MTNQWWRTAICSLALVAACGGNEPQNPTDVLTTQDGVQKPMNDRADAWNARNNPAGFQTEMDVVFDNLPLEGASSHVAWAETYWPYYEGGINARWQGANTLSPAEKWDKAFNSWTEPTGFMDLRPWNSNTCEFDEAYYASLGQAATWTDRNKGTWLAHNGVDDDGDGVEDKDECAQDSSEFDGLETWWGICHAWAPAAILEDEPLRAVERNGVTFEVSDIKALLIQQYDRSDAYMIGGRCNDKELERDENGRVISDDCRDLNAGSWHVIITNLLGTHSRPFVIERTTNYEVWNQPLVGYEVTEQHEITLEEAHALLQVEAEPAPVGTGEFVHDVEVGSPLAQAILDFVNTAPLTVLDDDARLYSTAARNIVNARPIATLAELDAISYVAATAFKSLADYVQSHGLVGGTTEYVYNADATRFVEVRMTTDYVTESYPSTEPRTPQAAQYTRHDYYHYVLELNDAGEILGGEWVGSSNTVHPDFVWLPVAARGGNPYIDIDEVRSMIAESRGDSGGGSADTHDYTSADPIEIPDYDPRGIASVLSVSDAGTVRAVRVDIDINHTYQGDLTVQLAHGGVVATIYSGNDSRTPWEDNVSLANVAADGFLGAELGGEWELRVVDRMVADVGTLVSWSLHVDAN